MTGDLRDVVVSEMERFGVPAAAVCVVAGDDVLLADSFGVRDVGSGIPAGPDTRFPLASDTKALTAALLCLQASEGLIDLDARVATYLPWFRLQDPLASAAVTVRDLLSHRTGLPRHDWVGAGDEPRTLEELARAMAHLEPAQALRQGPLYNNLAYCAVGLVSEQVSGRPWNDLLHDRLIGPLRMHQASLDPESVQKGDFAHGYSLFTGALVRQRPISRWHLGPPGGLFCTAADLVPWLQARLGDRPNVLGPEVLAELHRPAIPMPAGVDPERLPLGYALGCQVEAYDGHLLVHHGGSLPGWSSDVVVLPRDRVGVAVLSNLDQTPFPEALALTLVDAALGRPAASWGQRKQHQQESVIAAWQATRAAQVPAAGRPPRIPPVDLAGAYCHPAYGELALRQRGDELSISFHGIDELLSVRHVDLDRWEIRALDGMVQIPLVPLVGADGGVCGLSVGFEPLVSPIHFTRTDEQRS